MCTVPDNALEGLRAAMPPMFANAKRALATDCLARLLGLGGPARLRAWQPPWDVRLDFVTIDQAGAIGLSPVALTVLGALYGR